MLNKKCGTNASNENINQRKLTKSGNFNISLSES